MLKWFNARIHAIGDVGDYLVGGYTAHGSERSAEIAVFVQVIGEGCRILRSGVVAGWLKELRISNW